MCRFTALGKSDRRNFLKKSFSFFTRCLMETIFHQRTASPWGKHPNNETEFVNEASFSSTRLKLLVFPWQLYRVNFLGGREAGNTHNQFYISSFLWKPERALFSHSLKFFLKKENIYIFTLSTVQPESEFSMSHTMNSFIKQWLTEALCWTWRAWWWISQGHSFQRVQSLVGSQNDKDNLISICILYK